VPKRLASVLVLTAMVVAALLLGFLLAKGGRSVFREERVAGHGKL
jgi:hypothetical protein